jgi:hypothetical protein
VVKIGPVVLAAVGPWRMVLRLPSLRISKSDV